MLASAIRDLLVADGAVTGKLATYDFGTGNAPAVFTIEPAPADCANPVAVVLDDGGEPWGTRDQRGTHALGKVKVWGDKNHSRVALAAVADAVWLCLDRAVPTTSGWTWLSFDADPPVPLTDREGFPGFLIRVAAYGLKN